MKKLIQKKEWVYTTASKIEAAKENNTTQKTQENKD